MAYNRAPRRSLIASTQTGPNVSPNSYQVGYHETYCNCKGTNWAPFLSCAPRTITKREDTPGPNAYYPLITHRVVGGSSLSYTAQRFPEPLFTDPAPNEYDPYHSSEEFLDTPPPRLKGYLYHCNVPYTLLGYMPSVPTQKHIGYKIEDKLLSECCEPEEDTTLGPAYYRVNYDTFGTYYRGSYWSKYSKRAWDTHGGTPGVGTYDLNQEPTQLQEYLDKVRHERKKSACLPRYLDLVQNNALRNNYPAPNQYNVLKVKCLRSNRKLVPKRTVRSRKAIWKYETPAPNQYNDPRTAFEYLVKPSCKKELNAFLSNSPRFREVKQDSRPAPNQYHIQSFVELMEKKVSRYAVRHTAFDTSVPKKLYYLPPDYPPIVKRRPCRCSEMPVAPEPPPPKPHPTYPFSSKTKRFPTGKDSYDANCASYCVQKSFNYMKSPKSFRKAKRYNFLFKEKRFGKLTGFGAKEDKSYIPKLKYNLGRMKIKVTGAGKFSKAKRFPKTESSVPGPAHYAPICGGLSGHTFNVTLCNSASLSIFQKYRLCLRHGSDKKPVDLENKKPARDDQQQQKEVVPVNIEFPLPKEVPQKIVTLETE